MPETLNTRDGRSLRVLFAGVANTGAGPDFLGAQLRFDDGAAVRGDVELHIRASSWQGHGHQRDPRYDNVALHVVLMDDGLAAFTHAGREIPLLALGRVLRQDNLVTTGLPGPCYQPETARKARADIESVLIQAGTARFEARVNLWEGELAARPLEDCVLQALLRAAGMGKNADACAALASALDGRTLDTVLAASGERRSQVAIAIVLGMSGLLRAAHADDALYEAWAEYRDFWPGRPLDERHWHRFRLRPFNLPERRLQAVAAIIAAHGLEGFMRACVKAFSGGQARGASIMFELLAPKGVKLGRGWGLEAAANTILPLVAAHGRTIGDQALAGSATRCYASLPGGGDNRILRRMTKIAGLPTLPRSAITQQGLLHIWASYCCELRCAECPLAADSASALAEELHDLRPLLFAGHHLDKHHPLHGEDHAGHAG